MTGVPVSHPILTSTVEMPQDIVLTRHRVQRHKFALQRPAKKNFRAADEPFSCWICRDEVRQEPIALFFLKSR